MTKNVFKVNSVEVITGKKNDLLHIKFRSSGGIHCETIYKFKDTNRHKRSFGMWLKNNSTDFLMYNIKNKWKDKFVKCKCRHRTDGTLMVEEPLV